MSKSPTDSSAAEFGWPLPKRRQHFEDVKSGASHHQRIDFMDARLTLPVLRVPINLPKYRMLNGRTASAQQEWLAKHPDKPTDFFLQDPESDEVQRVQHELLGKLVTGAGLLTYFKQANNKQKEPLVLDTNGFVINGNRRLCAWRTLLKEDAKKYGHFEHIDVIVLPPGDDRAIDKLEGELQIEPEIRDDYTWDSLANMMRIRQALHGLDTGKLAEFYRRKKNEVEELLDMLDYAAKYLADRGMPRQWSEVSDKEFAFRQMVRKRESLNTAGEKQLFEAVAFVLIDDPEGGRLYEAIPDAHKNFELIKSALAQAFPVSAPGQQDGLDILGGAPVASMDVPLALAIDKDEESRKKAAGVVKNLIDMTKLLDKEKKSADFLISQLQKANTLIQNAVTAGLRPESRNDGVAQQLSAIEQGIARIKKWLSKKHA
jgi:hypothetical protein